MSEETAVGEVRYVAVIGESELAAGIASLCRQAGGEVVDLGDAELVIEAGDGDLAAVASAVGDSTLVATCTSFDPITPRVTRLRDPGRGAGLHFVGPATDQALVEVIAAEQTAPETVERLCEFVRWLGKEPVATKDRPGFLVRRLLMPYLNQAIQALDDGIATAEDIDTSVVLGLGYPVGPLRMLDAAGLDGHHRATVAAFEELHDPHYGPPPLLTRLVEAGFLGRSSGRGFYAYEETS